MLELADYGVLCQGAYSFYSIMLKVNYKIGQWACFLVMLDV